MTVLNAQCVDINLTHAANKRQGTQVDVNFTYARSPQTAQLVDLPLTVWAAPQIGYIAGCADGILTVGGKPAKRQILVFDAITLFPVKHLFSLPNGHYLADDLDPQREYLIIGRDNEKQYEPYAYDYIKPANDKTVAEQQELWNSWQAE